MTYIYNPDRFEQAALRKGSEHLGVASTDIDLVIELGDRGFIFVELKTAGTSLNPSQRMLFSRMVNNATTPTFVIVASHTTTPDQEICPNSIVEEVYWNTGNGLKYVGFDTQYDGDLISLNQLISTITWKVCPRLLNRNAELIAFEDFWVVEGMLAPWTSERGESDHSHLREPNSSYLDWRLELGLRQRQIGKTKQALSYSDYPCGWPQEAEICQLESRLTPQSTSAELLIVRRGPK